MVKSLTLVEIDVPSWIPTSPETVETWRFAIPTDYLPMEFDAIPSIASVDITPATVSLGENLGERADISVVFTDHRHIFGSEPWTQGTFWSKWRARYGTTLRGRPLRIIRGALGDMLEAMEVRHFMIEATDGPTPGGVYTIKAKDILKLADDDRSQAPLLSTGSLAGGVDDAATSATLSPTGIGDDEYPASGWVCIGGNEVCEFTRSGDNLTLVRAQFGSLASEHDAGERVQIVLRYDGDDPADIIHDLLTNYAGVDPAMIDLPAWQAETAAYLGVIFARTISEPTAVKKLISELVEQAALALWWDDLANQVRLQVLKEISTDAALFDEGLIVDGSLRVGEQPGKRISQIWTYFSQRDPTDQADNADNYAAAKVDADLTLQEAYGSPEIRKIFAGWIATLTAAERLNGIQLSRFRNPPRKFAFSLFADQAVALAGGYRLGWRFNTDQDGLEVTAPIQVTRIKAEADYLHIEAEEMLASGVIVVTNTVFLRTTGSVLTWEVPADWNDAENEIHVLGAGGGGSEDGGNGGGGGGGGAYAGSVNVNLTPGAMLSYRVGAGGGHSEDGGDTWFGGLTFGAALLAARGGDGGDGRDGGAGGVGTEGIGSVRFSGGSGGNGAPRGETRAGGGGGGAAAGPSGAGGNGGSNSSTSHDDGGGGGGADGGFDGANDPGGSGGGNNRFNFGGGTAAAPNGKQGGGGRGGASGSSGGLGGNGQEIWTQSVPPIISGGPGGGGGGGGDDGHGRNGGLYGGGGGGAGGSDGLPGDGAQGLIVISWREAS